MTKLMIYTFVITIGLCTRAESQTAHRLLQKGDNNYTAQDYERAEEYYRKAEIKDNNLKSNFNLGNTTYQLERYEEAIDYFIRATRKTKTDAQQSLSFYNLANAYFNNQQLEEAIEAYKQAIRLDATNEKAKYNLAVCKEILKQLQQQEQQNQEQQNENNESQEQNEENQQQQEGDPNENQENPSQESEQDSLQEQQANFDSTRLEKQNLDSLDAAKLLEIIQSEEQKVQEKLRKFNSKRKKPDKDW